MKQYFYGARDRQGVRQSGTIAAPNRGEALARLRDRFPLVLRLDEVGRPGSGWPSLLGREQVTDDDLLAFTHQLSSMLDAGLSFGAAMDILLLDKVHRRPVRKVLVQLAASVSEGRSFSEALKGHPNTFPELYVSMVEAGESSANVPEVLRRLAAYLERAMKVRLDLISALVYPSVVIVFGCIVAMAILLYGAPVLEQMYAAAGLKLPFFTQALISIGVFVRWAGVYLALGALVCYFFLPRAFASRWVKDWIERTLVTAGPLKDVLMEAAVARSCRTLATLYAGGVPVLTAIDMTAQSSGNIVLRQIFRKVHQQVSAGSNLSAPLLASPLFPPMAAGMITAGEAAGSLPRMLERLADYYECRLDFTLKTFSKFVEPVLIVGVGLMIGTVILALGLPFMNLASVLK